MENGSGNVSGKARDFLREHSYFSLIENAYLNGKCIFWFGIKYLSTLFYTFAHLDPIFLLYVLVISTHKKDTETNTVYQVNCIIIILDSRHSLLLRPLSIRFNIFSGYILACIYGKLYHPTTCQDLCAH